MHQTIQRLCVCIHVLFLFLPFFFFGFFLTPQEIFTGFIESLVLAWLLNNITYFFIEFFLNIKLSVIFFKKHALAIIIKKKNKNNTYN